MEEWIKGNDIPDGIEVEAEVKHCNTKLKLKNEIVKGRMGDDNFYLLEGGELSFNWDIISWNPTINNKT